MRSESEKEKDKRFEEKCNISIKTIQDKKAEMMAYIVENVTEDEQAAIDGYYKVKETFTVDELVYLASIAIASELAERLTSNPAFATICALKRKMAKTKKEREN
jgi:hypothetical protein